MTLVLSVLEQGMIYAIMALGIYITYTILDFPDLTVDGSFPLGAALSAVLITKGVNPILTLLVTFAAGALAGMLTGIIHVKLKVRDLLSGIIMMTALYTVNLRIAGRANLPIYNMTTLFDNDFVRNVFKGGLAQFSNVIIILVITLVMKFLLDWYMSTKSGYLLRAVGDNETIVTSMGGQGHHKNHRPCNRQRPLQLKRMHFCTAAEIFRRINGNRNNGYRTGERYYRNQPA